MKGTLLESALRPGALSVVFQPILEIGAAPFRLHAYESLIRGPAGTNLERADVLFEYARLKHEEARLDRVCVAAALAEAARIPGAPELSVNVHASTLATDPGLPRVVALAAEGAGIATSRLIVEIVEYAPFWGGEPFLANLEALRALGARIALDDVGHGQSNYRMILDSRPDYFKIDRYFVSGACRDPLREAILASVLDLATRFRARVVAEGVEEPQDLDLLQRLGIPLAQGWLFSRAVPADALRDEPPAESRPAPLPRPAAQEARA